MEITLMRIAATTSITPGALIKPELITFNNILLVEQVAHNDARKL